MTIESLAAAAREAAKPAAPTNRPNEVSGAIPKTGSSYPDDNPKTVFGTAKPSVHAIPPSAIIHLGQAMAVGERKYGLLNYRDKRVTASTYYNAAFRHLLEYWDGENRDGESGCHPLAHVMACCAIILDAENQGTLNDDRGTAGYVHGLISALSKPISAA